MNTETTPANVGSNEGLGGMQYTPAPWRIAHDCNSPDGGINDVRDARGDGVATACLRLNRRAPPMRRDETAGEYVARASAPGERAANARLIAAAPDLLEALQAICEEMDGQQGYATLEVYDKARAAIAKALPPNAEVSGGRRSSAALPGCAEPAGKTKGGSSATDEL